MRFVLKFLFLCFCLHSSNILAQGIIMEYSNGEIFTPTTPILATDTCIFRLGNNLKANWALKLVKQDGHGKYMETVFEKLNAKSFEFNAQQFRNTFNSQIYRIEDYSNETVYYEGYVTIEIDNNVNDSINLIFDLVPTRPQITEVKFTYSKYDFQDDFFFANPYYNMKIHSGRCDKLYLDISDISGGPNCFEFDHTIVFDVSTSKRIHTINDSTFSFQSNSDFWCGQNIRWIALNEFGFSLYSDTLRMLDFVTDNNIRLELEEYFETTQSIQYNTIDKTFKVIDRTVYTNDIQDNIIIHDLTGRTVSMHHKTNTVNLANLTSGPYFITLIKNHIKTTKKIVL